MSAYNPENMGSVIKARRNRDKAASIVASLTEFDDAEGLYLAASLLSHLELVCATLENERASIEKPITEAEMKVLADIMDFYSCSERGITEAMLARAPGVGYVKRKRLLAYLKNKYVAG
jgi:hypothetical protein